MQSADRQDNSVQQRNVRLNVTLRRVRVTNVTVQQKEVLYILSVRVCCLSYPARKAHAPYCRLQPVWLYHTFCVLSHKRQDFRKQDVGHDT